MAKNIYENQAAKTGEVFFPRIQQMQNLWQAACLLRKFGICRICFRELAYKGEIPGVKKASW